MSEATKKILLVEDDAEVREFIKTALEMENYEVLTAPNGIQLTSKIKAYKPDLILLDIELPWVDGYELCKAIKAHPAYRKLPVAFVSVRKRPDEVEAGLKCGADDYITKPIDLDSFLETVRRLTKVVELNQ